MKNYLENFLELLKEYVSFESVSTDRSFRPQIKKQVDWLKNLFEKKHFKVTILKGEKTNPVVFAEYHVADDLPTTMVYGHYDVQPAEIRDGWGHDPFCLYETTDGRVSGRGVVDNKGQNLIHMYTAFKLISEDRLGCNLKFLIEGNEETMNDELAGLIEANRELLSCDEIIVSDGEILGDTPTIEESLRGGGNLTLTFKTAENDLHSGLYGSGVPSAIKEMVAFLAKTLKTNGTVVMTDFYKSVDNITQEQTIRNEKLTEIDNPEKSGVVKSLIGPHDFHTMVGLWPAVEISGITSGYAGIGYKNIIPGLATAKINFRLVASQSPEWFVGLFEAHLEENVPNYVDYEVSIDKTYYPVRVDTSSKRIQNIMKLQEKIYGITPVIKNVGGGIPVIGDFQNILGIDTILLPLGNNDCNMHGANENFRIDLIEKGLKISEAILQK